MFHLSKRVLALSSVIFMMASPTMAQETILTLDQALSKALAGSPVLAASQSRASAADAVRAQAGALPNPEAVFEADNIYGDGPYDGLDGAELTAGVSQLIEMPGKRGGRVAVANAQANQSHYGRDTARLDLIRDVTTAYAEMVAAQKEVSILEDELTLVSAVYESVAAKVKAGKEPPIQESKAKIERASSEIALERAKRTLIACQQMLNNLMGGETAAFQVGTAGLPKMAAPMALDIYRDRLAQTPDARIEETGVTQAQSALSLERAHAVPDPTFNVGIKNLREDDAQAMVAGVSFPLPVFNRNRAGIDRAGHEVNAAIMDQRSAQLSRDAQLVRVYNDFSNAYAEVTTLEFTVLPGAEEAFSIARQGYDAGKFAYLEMLDAQRTLFETRKQMNAALLDYYRQRAALERLTTSYSTKDVSHEKK